MRSTLVERFYPKVGETDPDTYCMPWLGAVDSHGYGRLFVERGVFVGAHRVAYERWHGEIPPGLQIDHLCRNRKCVNPHHLEAVPKIENIRRGANNNRKKSDCPAGHPYAGDNLYVYKGRRFCRACMRAAGRKYDREKRR